MPQLTHESAERMIRFVLDRDQPGWETEYYYCPPCRGHHEMIRNVEQLQLGDERSLNSGKNNRRLPAIPDGAPEGYCRWHETASPERAAPCAYCGAQLHVHQDALAKVKPRQGEHDSYLTQKCPACHRPNAVHPTYVEGVVRASKLDGDTPVVQTNMGLH